MKKQHFNATQVARITNARANRDPFYTQSMAEHLQGTKHSKAWGSYGYNDVLVFAMYFDMYRRCGLAFSGVKQPVEMCWSDFPRVHVGEQDDKETAREKEFKRFAKRVKLWKCLKQVDEMQRVGKFAGLIVRLADGKRPEEPLEGNYSLDAIVSLQPAWEGQLTPGTVDSDQTSARYDLPLSYTYTQRSKGSNDERELQAQTIHWTRILTFAESSYGNSIYGRSCMESPFNALMDWEKIRGAGGEGYWRAAAQRLVLKSKDGEIPTEDEIDDINDMIADMYSGMDSVPGIGGYDLEALITNMPTGDHAAKTALQDASAGFMIPEKVLIGAQTGVLAGTEDGDQFRMLMQSRRVNWCTDMVNQFLDFLASIGATESSEELTVTFNDLTEPNSSQKLENASKMKSINGIEPESVFTTDEIRVAAGYEARSEEELEEYADLLAERKALESEPEDNDDVFGNE